MKSILVLLHCQANTGYAIGPLERTFYETAVQLCDGDAGRVHFAYPSMPEGPSPTLPLHFNQYLIAESTSEDRHHHLSVAAYVREHAIDTVLGFDQPVHLPLYAALRKAGVKHFVSYWGAAMSSLQPLPVLWIKRLQVALSRHGPDHYVFESQGMADCAVLGRGIAPQHVSIVRLGVDTDRYTPTGPKGPSLQQLFSIPSQRRVFFYSGHMEPRKGVPVLMAAANMLAAQRSTDDWHLLIAGNKQDEHLRWQALLTQSATERVTFAGYRNDLPALHRHCHAAVIASTGWDSFTLSAIEAQASGLPLLVSDLQGLREAVEPDVTGYRFPVGDGVALAARMQQLLDDLPLRDRLGQAARLRVLQHFSELAQRRNLLQVMRQVCRVPEPAGMSGHQKFGKTTA